MADAIRKRRVELDLSQQALADAARVSLRTVANLEAGQPAKERTLVRIERALKWAQGSVEAVLDTPEGEATPASPLGSMGSGQDADKPFALILDASLEDLFVMCRAMQADERYGAPGAEKWLADALELRRRARLHEEATKSEHV